MNVDGSVPCGYLRYFHQCYASSNVDPAYKESENGQECGVDFGPFPVITVA